MRHKTKYTGVFYRRLGKSGGDKSFYIVYKKQGRSFEEQVGRYKTDGMTPFKAACIRNERIKGRYRFHLPGKTKKAPDSRIKGNPATDGRPGRLTIQADDFSGISGENAFPENYFAHPLEITHLMLEYANDAVYISQDNITRFVNSKTEKITGYAFCELVGKSSFNLTHPEDLKIIQERYLRRFRGEDVSDLFPHRILDKQGCVKWIEVSTVMVMWEGRPALLNFMRDISQRKRDEEALKQSEQFRTDIFNFLPEATFAIDNQGRVTAWNRAMEELTGVDAGRMIGKGNYAYAKMLYGEARPTLIDKVLDPSLSIVEHVRPHSRTEDFLLAETQLWYSGELKVFWSKAGRMKDSDGNSIGAIESLRDISAFKSMNAALDTILKKRERDIQRTEEKIVRNIKELILPYVLRLKSANLEFSQAVDVDIIEKHLKEITSPFLSRLTSEYVQLSPREMQVSNMIKNGMTSKEIARALSVSTNAIDIYRQKIRRKLGLNKKKINLRSFLNSLGRDE